MRIAIISIVVLVTVVTATFAYSLVSSFKDIQASRVSSIELALR